MFNKYFRAYPYWVQLFLFVVLVFTLMPFSGYMCEKLLHITTDELMAITDKSSPELLNKALLFQCFTSIGSFLLPALLFAYFTHPRPAEYLGLRRPGKPIHWLLTILLMLGAIPALLALEGLIRQINLGTTANQLQKESDDMMGGFLNITSLSSFVRAFIIMAIIPAAGEELFFRGTILRFAKKKSSGMAYPILLTATVFALFHGTIYGFLPIFLAGMLLAYVYYLTGSLWCSILAHTIFNGLQIILIYLGNTNAALKHALDENTLPVYLTIGGLVIFGLALWGLLKTKTPLPIGWAMDYTAEEFAQEEQ